jgi:hypothetical protein
MAALTIMRAIPHYFTRRDLCHGSFVFTLTHLHQSNIFIGDAWHVKRLIDLEWVCSLPVEILHPPTWLTYRAVDQLEEGEHLDAYTSVHAEFMDAFEEEERSFPPADGDSLYRTRIMKRRWKTGNF